ALMPGAVASAGAGAVHPPGSGVCQADPVLAADRAGAAAPGRQPYLRSQRPAGDRGSAAARGTPVSAAVASGCAMGQGRAGWRPVVAAADPPALGTFGRRRAAVRLSRAGPTVASGDGE